MSEAKVVELFGSDRTRIRQAMADLESADDIVFREAYHWVFNSLFFIEEGFEQTCERAGVSFVAMMEKLAPKRQNLDLRFERILFGPRGANWR